MIKKMAIVANIALVFFTMQPVYADAEWDKLEAEYELAHDKWEEAMQNLQGDGGTIKFNPAEMPPHPIEEFRARFREYVEKNAGKPEALSALGHMLDSGFSMMGGKDESAEWAVVQLKEDYATDPRIADYVEKVRHAVMSVGADAVIEFMETIAEQNPDRETKGSARLAMAEVLYEGSPFAMMMQGMSGTAETKAKKKRAIKILRDIKTQFTGNELAERADNFLFAIDHLQVGMKAPDIVGKDVYGKEIRLSQFEGQVVTVVFWATWCVPCIQMLPHERELMEKHAGNPFTILGINIDNTLEDCKKTMKKEKITWPTIYDGSIADSKITKKWRVRSFPTIFMIDHKGLIQHTNLAPFQLEGVVNELVAKAVEDDG